MPPLLNICSASLSFSVLLCLSCVFVLYFSFVLATPSVPVWKHLSLHFHFHHLCFPCSQQKPLSEASNSLFWHLEQSRLKLVLRKQGIQWLSLDKTITWTSYRWPFRPTYARVLEWLICNLRKCVQSWSIAYPLCVQFCK